MIDLTNKTIDDVNVLIQKYTPVLELIKTNQDNIPHLAVIIDIAVNYIKNNYNDLSIDWKIWSVYLIKEMSIKNIIKTEDDICKEINEFISYYNLKYQNYCEDMVSTSDFERDRIFVRKYINWSI